MDTGQTPAAPTELDVPEELRFEELRPQPRACLRIQAAPNYAGPSEKLKAELSFDYGSWQVGDQEKAPGVYRAKERCFLRRDAPAEAAAAQLLTELGGKFQTYYDQHAQWLIAPKKLPRAVRGLVEAGWHIEAEGKVFRRPGASSLEVSSGIDWFELHGEVEYGETTAQMPELLEALRAAKRWSAWTTGLTACCRKSG